MLKRIRENKRIQFALGYGIFHLLCYFVLESNDTPIHILQCPLDNMIPFCEYFIIPYVLWYAFVALTVYYFAVVNERKKEYYQLMLSLCSGMFIFGVVSLVYPNGHTLRPVLGDGGIFIKAVNLLYTIDTSTNILPSLHVYEAVACCMAILKNRECRMKKWLIRITGILTILIVLSTMFLKQHTVIDVIAALILNFVCYLLVYRWAEKYIDRWSILLTRKEICTIPNLLSVTRLFIAILICGICQRWSLDEQWGIIIILLMISGISDFLDGKIARKYNQISEIGKILDPISDKVTQGILLLCLWKEFPIVRSLFVIFIIKEIIMVINGIKVITVTHVNDGALWFGKINTALFYGIMAVLVLWRNIPMDIANLLLMICGSSMLVTLVCYIREYKKKLSTGKVIV